jgi:GDP-L-fucose synthase
VSDPGNNFWLRKRVLLTGGGGFVGSAVREALLRRGVPEACIVVPRSRSLDLRILENCREAIQGCDVVIHLAARTGGIAFAREHPASQYRDSSLINLNMLEVAREAGVAKFIGLGNLLAYPAIAPSPLVETGLYDGPVAVTHLGVGQSKRDLVMLTEMYHREHGLDAVCVLGANAYGPGDKFDLEYGHVIPSTIMKCLRDEDLVVWGDGAATRDFLYVDDLASGILLAAERLEAPACVNVASGIEVSVADLVRMIADLCGFRRRIVFDASKGGGDPRRVASTECARRDIGFSPMVSLEAGLRRTIDWYRDQAGAAA